MTIAEDKKQTSPEGIPEKGHGVSRRDFLKGGAAVGALAALATYSGPLILAQPQPTPTPTPTPTPIPPTGAPATGRPAMIYEALQFFVPYQADIINEAAGRIIPGTPDDPGAKEAGVIVFIDEALDGYDRNLQADYFAGIQGMEAYAEAKFNQSFVELADADKDAILSNMQSNSDEAKQYLPDPAAFFNTLLNHVREGMFSDPIYGGNRDKAGWKLLGHPGIVFSRNPSEQQCNIDVPKEYMGVMEYYMNHPS